MLRDIFEAEVALKDREVVRLKQELDSMHDYAKDLEGMIVRLEALKDIEDAMSKEDAYSRVFGADPGKKPSFVMRRIFNVLHRHLGKPVPTQMIYDYVYSDKENPPKGNIMSVHMKHMRDRLPAGYSITHMSGQGYALVRDARQGPQGS